MDFPLVISAGLAAASAALLALFLLDSDDRRRS